MACKYCDYITKEGFVTFPTPLYSNDAGDTALYIDYRGLVFETRYNRAVVPINYCPICRMNLSGKPEINIPRTCQECKDWEFGKVSYFCEHCDILLERDDIGLGED